MGQGLSSLSALGRPRGLQARAMLFTAVVMAVTTVLTAAIVLFGVNRENERQQLTLARENTYHLALRSADAISRGRTEVIGYTISGLSQRNDARALAVRDANGVTIAQDGADARDNAAMDRLARRVMSEREASFERGDGLLAVAVPIEHDGQFVGVALRVWESGAYRFDVVQTLAPFLFMVLLLTISAMLVAAHLVRRAMSPLTELTRFAEQVAERGQPSQISIQSGDEFETLANAFNDMTTRLEASMRQIEEIAFVDPATRLSNQDRFSREVDFFILQQGEGASGAVVVVELQRLAKLMQTFDPIASRDFIRLVAERLTSSARTVERVVVRRREQSLCARLGVAEFAVFAPGLSQADAARFAQHLTAALNQPFEWRGHKLTLGAFCGVAMAPRDGKDADTVIRHARMALGAAQNTTARMKLYTQSLDREAVARITLEREMRGALERNEFRAYFQPKINLASGKIEACEALARWIRPDRTIISPGRFIPVAEESGLISPLSDAILREACWKAASWARAGLSTKVAVNVSALQFKTERFAENVLRVVQHAGLTPNNLELEITESMVMEDPDRALRVIQPLREAGVRLAIDDFGCGHSSLAALSKLPFDVIKIDQQFVRQLERGDGQAAAIIEMILALARTLDMEVVAEGVERKQEVEFMAARGCEWVQGFLYGAAVPAAEFAEMLRRQAGEDVTAEDAA